MSRGRKMFSKKNSQCYLRFDDFKDFLDTFSGDDNMDIKKWVQDFDEMADLFQWTDLQKVVYARNLLTGTAKSFVKYSNCWKQWGTMKKALIENFQKAIDTDQVHEQLSNEKKKEDESFESFIYRMFDMGSPAGVPKPMIIRYIIDAIEDDPENKAALNEAKTIKELKELFKEYEKKKKEEMNKTVSEDDENKTESVVSGSTLSGHEKCLRWILFDNDDNTQIYSKEILKCDKCNEFGHTETDCKQDEEAKIEKMIELERENFNLRRTNRIIRGDINRALLKCKTVAKDLVNTRSDLVKIQLEYENIQKSKNELRESLKEKREQLAKEEREKENVKAELELLQKKLKIWESSGEKVPSENEMELLLTLKLINEELEEINEKLKKYE